MPGRFARAGGSAVEVNSYPRKDPRGKHRADVFLDEFVHYGGKQQAIYVAAVPIVTKNGPVFGFPVFSWRGKANLALNRDLTDSTPPGNSMIQRLSPKSDEG